MIAGWNHTRGLLSAGRSRDLCVLLHVVIRDDLFSYVIWESLAFWFRRCTQQRPLRILYVDIVGDVEILQNLLCNVREVGGNISALMEALGGIYDNRDGDRRVVDWSESRERRNVVDFVITMRYRIDLLRSAGFACRRVSIEDGHFAGSMQHYALEHFFHFCRG